MYVCMSMCTLDVCEHIYSVLSKVYVYTHTSRTHAHTHTYTHELTSMLAGEGEYRRGLGHQGRDAVLANHELLLQLRS